MNPAHRCRGTGVLRYGANPQGLDLARGQRAICPGCPDCRERPPAVQYTTGRRRMWRGRPSACEVAAHAKAHPIGAAPLTPDPTDDWRQAPMVPIGLWVVRGARGPELSAEVRAALGWWSDERMACFYPLGEHEGRVWFGVRLLTNDLALAVWAGRAEFRPVDPDGFAVEWPDVSV